MQTECLPKEQQFIYYHISLELKKSAPNEWAPQHSSLTSMNHVQSFRVTKPCQ